MFEWLKHNESIGEITGYNPKTNKLIYNEIEGDEEDLETNIFGASIYGSGLIHDVIHFENWAEKMYNKFINENRLDFVVMSTQNSEVWNFTIYRKEFEIDVSDMTDEEDNRKIINYVIVFAGDVEYVESLTKEDESLNFFENWYEEISYDLEIFNRFDNHMGFDYISFENSFLTKEEYNLLWDLFDKANQTRSA